jgi:hypothetical protein
VIASCDTETSHEVICYSPDGGLELERSPIGSNEAVDGNSNNQGDVEPIDMFVPIRLGDGLLGDVRFLGIVLLVTIWL